MRGKTIYVMNRLENIKKLCMLHAIEFYHVPGLLNPADCTTRELSGQVLLKTTFYSGPDMTSISNDIYKVLVPNPIECVQAESVTAQACILPVDLSKDREPLIPLDKFSSFKKAVAVIGYCFQFISRLKDRLKLKNPELYGHLSSSYASELSCTEAASFYLIGECQRVNFKDIFEYLERKHPKKMDIPELCSKLNIFKDKFGLLRVKSKMKNAKVDFREKYPILLPKSCPVTKAIIWDVHCKLSHCGVYSVLNTLRKEFWILSYYSAVKKVIKLCLWCTRQNARAIKVNCNDYRTFRVDPDCIPFRDVMMDHIGPFTVKVGGKNEKDT